MSSRKQSKRAAFAHRRREWRRIVAEYKAWREHGPDDLVDAFRHKYLLNPMPTPVRPTSGPGWVAIAGPVHRESVFKIMGGDRIAGKSPHSLVIDDLA